MLPEFGLAARHALRATKASSKAVVYLMAKILRTPSLAPQLLTTRMPWRCWVVSALILPRTLSDVD